MPRRSRHRSRTCLDHIAIKGADLPAHCVRAVEQRRHGGDDDAGPVRRRPWIADQHVATVAAFHNELVHQDTLAEDQPHLHRRRRDAVAGLG